MNCRMSSSGKKEGVKPTPFNFSRVGDTDAGKKKFKRCRFDPFFYQASMIPRGGFVFHLPRVKSGISTGRPLPATLFTLAPTMALQAAAS